MVEQCDTTSAGSGEGMGRSDTGYACPDDDYIILFAGGVQSALPG